VTALWGTEKLEIGTITEPTRRDFSRDFSSAVSLVVTVSIASFAPQAHFALGWRIDDSIDGTHWWSLEDTTGEYRGSVGCFTNHGFMRSTRNAQTRRFVVPFGPTLSVGFETYSPNRQVQQVEGSFEGVVAILFWRGIG